MKIYTGFGDSGRTHLYGGQVVPKDHLRVEAYGTADELNSFLGLLISELSDDSRRNFLQQIQQTIFRLSSDLATPDDKKKNRQSPAIREKDILSLEEAIDKMETELQPLKNFILPGGGKLAALTHIARTVCRRLERRLITLNAHSPLDAALLVFLNRLSDYLFVLARMFNHQSGVEELIWKSE